MPIIRFGEKTGRKIAGESMLEERLREIFGKTPDSRQDMLDACGQIFAALVSGARNTDAAETLCRELEREREKNLRLELEIREMEKKNESFASEFGGYRKDYDGLQEFVLEIFDLLGKHESCGNVVKELRCGVISRASLSDELERRLWLI